MDRRDLTGGWVKDKSRWRIQQMQEGNRGTDAWLWGSRGGQQDLVQCLREREEATKHPKGDITSTSQWEY